MTASVSAQGTPRLVHPYVPDGLRDRRAVRSAGLAALIVGLGANLGLLSVLGVGSDARPEARPRPTRSAAVRELAIPTRIPNASIASAAVAPSAASTSSDIDINRPESSPTSGAYRNNRPTSSAAPLPAFSAPSPSPTPARADAGDSGPLPPGSARTTTRTTSPPTAEAAPPHRPRPDATPEPPASNPGAAPTLVAGATAGTATQPAVPGSGDAVGTGPGGPPADDDTGAAAPRGPHSHHGPSNPLPDAKAAMASWTQRVVALLRQKIRYPRAAEADQLEGTVLVRISLDAAGTIVAATVAKTSGEALLDREALLQVRALGRLTAPPDTTPRTLDVPIDFVLPREQR